MLLRIWIKSRLVQTLQWYNMVQKDKSKMGQPHDNGCCTASYIYLEVQISGV